MPLVEEKPNGFPTKAFGNDKRVSPNAVCKFRVIASEAKQSLIEKRLLRRLAAPRNDTDNKNSHMTYIIDLCRTKRIEVVNIGLCLLNDKSKFFSLVVQRPIIQTYLEKLHSTADFAQRYVTKLITFVLVHCNINF